jgi:hypothetical protein
LPNRLERTPGEKPRRHGSPAFAGADSFVSSRTIHVIACDKREAFAQGRTCDDAIHSFIGEMDCFGALAMTA